MERKEVETSELGVDIRWKALGDCKTMIYLFLFIALLSVMIDNT